IGSCWLTAAITATGRTDEDDERGPPETHSSARIPTLVAGAAFSILRGMSQPDARAVVSQLTGSFWALVTLGSALELGLLDHLPEPQTAEELAERCGTTAPLVQRMLDVLVASDLIGRDGNRYVAGALAPMLEGSGRLSLQLDLASTVLQ